MNILESKVYEYTEYTNDLTKEMDLCLIKPLNPFKTYICPFRMTNKYFVRYSGSFVAYILVDENDKIIGIEILEGIKKYDIKVIDVFKKYIGYGIKFN